MVLRRAIHSKRARVRLGTVGIAILCGTLLSSCLVTQAPAKIYRWNGPDPAVVKMSSTTARVYTTNAKIGPYNVDANVPTFAWNYASGSPLGSPTWTDALKNQNRPAWVRKNPNDAKAFVWAPTVRRVGGRYLMMFSASRVDGSACIGAATSSDGVNFSGASLQWCDPDPAYGWLDPDLFIDPAGGVHLYWSRQRSAGGGSWIMYQQLSSDGMVRMGSPRTLFSYSDVARQIPGTALGAKPYVENPAVVKDPYDGYTILVSVGSWGDSGSTYHTFELPCRARNDYCVPANGGILPLAGAGRRNAGGASLMTDDSPDGNQVVFHAHGATGADRLVWAAKTEALNTNPRKSGLREDRRIEGTAVDVVRSGPPIISNPKAPAWNRPERVVPMRTDA